jgi:hypothetical protein
MTHTKGFSLWPALVCNTYQGKEPIDWPIWIKGITRTNETASWMSFSHRREKFWSDWRLTEKRCALIKSGNFQNFYRMLRKPRQIRRTGVFLYSEGGCPWRKKEEWYTWWWLNPMRHKDIGCWDDWQDRKCTYRHKNGARGRNYCYRANYFLQWMHCLLKHKILEFVFKCFT